MSYIADPGLCPDREKPHDPHWWSNGTYDVKCPGVLGCSEYLCGKSGTVRDCGDSACDNHISKMFPSGYTNCLRCAKRFEGRRDPLRR